MQRPRIDNIAVMASGAGSTLAALTAAERAGELDSRIALLVVSRTGTGAAEVASRMAIPVEVVDEKLIGTEAADGRQLELFTAHAIDLVVLAGYLRLIGPRTLQAYAGRMINTHPAPLPEFGGKGMYGRRVHEAVLAAGVRHSAATVHLVDAEYDHGAVLATIEVPVQPGDDIDALQARVQFAERELLIATINRLAAGDATTSA